MTIEPGQALRVRVEQRRVDVTLTLTSNKSSAATVDSPNGRYGDETLVAVEPGTFALRVEANEGDGAYHLKVEKLGPVEDRDRAWVEALELLRQADAAESEDEALVLYQHGLDKVASIVPRTDLEGAGGAPEIEMERSLETIPARTVDGAELALLEARLRRGFGRTLQRLQRHGEAARELEQAAELIGAHGVDWELAAVLNDLGQTYQLDEDLPAAEAAQLRALEAATRAGHDAARAVAHNNLAVIDMMRYDLQGALSNLHAAFDAGRGVVKPEVQAVWRYNAGLHYAELGHALGARLHLERALAIWEQVEDLEGVAQARSALAWIYHRQGDFERADEALRRALELARQRDDRRAEGGLLEQLGLQLLAEGRVEEAGDALVRARRLSSGRALSLAYLDAELGAVRRARGDADGAVELLQRAVAAFERLDVVRGEIGARVELARAERLRGDLEAATRQLERALAEVESLRAELTGSDFRRSFFADRAELYDLYIELLFEQGRPEEAFAVGERGRARALLDLLREASRHERGGERARQVRQRILCLEERRQQLLDEGAESEVTALERQLDQLLLEHRSLVATASEAVEPLDLGAVREQVLDDDSQLLVYHLGAERSRLWWVDRGGVEAFELAPAAQIEQLALRVHELLGTPDPERRLERQRALEALADAVLAPLAGVPSAARWVIVASGALETVPFGALPWTASEPLLVSREIVHLPSASAAARLRQRAAGRSPAPELLAMIADPVFQPDDPRFEGAGPAGGERPAGGTATGAFPAMASPLAELERDSSRLERLPFAAEEAAEILALVPPGGVRRATAFDAALELVLSGELSRYRLLHFATHARFDARLPSLSGIHLSRFRRDRTSRPSFLSLLDLFDLRLPADLVVLSACETGRGRQMGGEGQLGLAHGFFAAGASRLVASYWKVDDRATAELMTLFYRGLLEDRLPPGEALRRAQLEVRERREEPYFWAGFAFHGDWRPIALDRR